MITKVIESPVGVFFMNTDVFGIDGTAGLQLIEISILDGRVEDMIRSRESILILLHTGSMGELFGTEVLFIFLMVKGPLR